MKVLAALLIIQGHKSNRMIGWVYESSRVKTKQAQEDLDEFYLKDSITDLQNAKDAELKLLDERIKNWDDYLRMLQTRYEEFDRLQEQKLLMELTGAKSQEEIYAIISGDMTNFIEYMDNNLDKFFDNQIEAFSNFNTTFSDFLDTYKDNLQELYDIKIKDVEVISADDWLDKNDKFLDTTAPEYTGDLTLGQKRPFVWNPQDLYEVVENESKLMKNNPESQKYIDTMTGEFLDYSAIARDLLEKGDLYGATQALWERNEKIAHNQGTYGNVQTNTEFLKKMLEERVIDKAQYDELVKAVRDQTPETTKMVETAVNKINQAAAQRAYQQGLSDYTEIQIESASMQFVEALATNMPRITEQGVNQLIDLTMQTGILGAGINDNIGIVDGTLHSEAEALLDGINKSRDALVDLLTSINKNLTEEEAQQIIDQAYGDATGGGSQDEPWEITVDREGNSNTGHTSDDNYYSGATTFHTDLGAGTYAAGSQGAKDFINNAPAGSTMTGGDGSTWIKNSDGSTTVTKNGTTYSTKDGTIKTYATGIENGPVTYTGLTMLHGTPTAPEYVLNTDQAGNVLKYIGTHENASNSLANMVSSLQQDTLTSSGLIKRCFEKIFGNIDELNVVSAPYIGLSGIDSNQFKVTHNKWEDEYLRNMATARMAQVVNNNTISNDTYYEINGDIVLENCDNPAKFWDKVTAQMGNRWNVTKRTK